MLKWIKNYLTAILMICALTIPVNINAEADWRIEDYVNIAQAIYKGQTKDRIIHKTYNRSKLSKKIQAFGMYAYQYNCNSVSYKDSRIKTAGGYGEYHGITKSNIKNILKELYGNSKATSGYIKNYTEGKKGKYYLSPATGDFGDAGSYYFDTVSAKLRKKGKYTIITGKVMVWNVKRNQFEGRETYTLKYLKRRSKNGIHRFVSIKVK